MENRGLLLEESFLVDSKTTYYYFKKFNKTLFLIVAIFPILKGAIEFKFTNMAIYILCALLLYLPYWLEKKWEIIVLEECKFVTIIHIALHTILGKTFHFYQTFPIFDSILHILGGGWLFILIAPFVLSIEMEFTLLTQNQINIKSSIISFALVNLVGVFWEIFEFVSDLIFADTPGYYLSQEGSLFDTMTDIIENNIGLLLYCFIFWKLISFQDKRGRNILNIFRKILPYNHKLN
jgi:hypothetical protein